MDPILTITATHTEALLAYVGTLFTDLWAFIALAIGIPLAFYVIARSIGLIRTRTRK